MKSLFYKLSVVFLAFFISINTSSGQTLEELKAKKAELEAQIGPLQAELNGIITAIEKFPGWKFGGVGVLGFNVSGNDQWFAIDQPFSSTYGYGISAAAFAKQDQAKYFWYNNLNVNLNKTFSKEDEEADEVESTTDALDFSSLGGYKFNPKWAVSAEAKYASTILNINDPGKLTASAGVTWLPIENLVVIIHPLGYEKNWPGELISAAGAKLGATYATTLFKSVAWSSNLSAFFPYSGGNATYVNSLDENVEVELGAGDLMNWTWINGFSTSLWKGLGVGFNIGLRQDKQLADRYNFRLNDEASDNPLQVYYNLGLSYTL